MTPTKAPKKEKKVKEATPEGVASPTPVAKKTKTEKSDAHPKVEKEIKKDSAKTKKGESAITQAVVNIGMIGHVDHGKTSLTRALTGKWTDTHSEEVKRGISIRLGYADATFYRYDGLTGSEAFGTKNENPLGKDKGVHIQRKVSFVDAPGHETLMTTMLSGAALMQGAILVIAANETCPQPSTAEHLIALTLSGVKHVVVAQNKVDLVPKEKALENYRQIQVFLKSHGFEHAPIIPVAANFNGNIDALIEAIETAIPTPVFDGTKTLKMFIARSFDVNKPGTQIEALKGGVLGGSIICGKLEIGEEIEISPGLDGKKLSTKVMSLHTSDGALSQAIPGGLIAIGTELDPGLAKGDAFRGQVAGLKGHVPDAVDFLKLKYQVIERLIGKDRSDLKMNDVIVLTVGTNTAVGNVTALHKDTVECRLKNAVVIEKGEKVAISKREEGKWRLVGYGESA